MAYLRPAWLQSETLSQKSKPKMGVGKIFCREMGNTKVSAAFPLSHAKGCLLAYYLESLSS